MLHSIKIYYVLEKVSGFPRPPKKAGPQTAPAVLKSTSSFIKHCFIKHCFFSYPDLQANFPRKLPLQFLTTLLDLLYIWIQQNFRYCSSSCSAGSSKIKIRTSSCNNAHWNLFIIAWRSPNFVFRWSRQAGNRSGNVWDPDSVLPVYLFFQYYYCKKLPATNLL